MKRQQNKKTSAYNLVYGSTFFIPTMHWFEWNDITTLYDSWFNLCIHHKHLPSLYITCVCLKMPNDWPKTRELDDSHNIIIVPDVPEIDSDIHSYDVKYVYWFSLYFMIFVYSLLDQLNHNIALTFYLLGNIYLYNALDRKNNSKIKQ